MTTPELLPCPFCGSSHVRLIDPASGSGYLYILCEGCLSAGKQSKDSAVCIAAWNSRSARPDTRSEVLEEAARLAVLSRNPAQYLLDALPKHDDPDQQAERRDRQPLRHLPEPDDGPDDRKAGGYGVDIVARQLG